MARGHQKIQAQQKNQKKMDAKKKAESGSNAKAAAEKAMNYKCPVCMLPLTEIKIYREHFENKHPKAELPDELKALSA